MSVSPSSSHVVLAIQNPLAAPTIMTTTMQVPKYSPARSLKDKNKIRSTPVITSLLRSASATGEGLFNSLIHRTITHRQRAEIQLQGILNDPEVSLPSFARRASDHLSGEMMSIEEASKLLNTQPFILKRLLTALYHSEKNELDNQEVQQLTRALTGTMDVRALLFFMILDADSDQYVTGSGLAQFYEEYFQGIKTFDKNRATEVIPILLSKFRLDQKSRIDYEEFFSIVSKDSTLLESLSQFTIDPQWFVKSIPEKQTTLQHLLGSICWQQKIYEQQSAKLTRDYIKDNLSRIIVITIYFLVNLALTLYVIIFRSMKTKSNILVVFARIGGMLLNFNCALVIILMLKRTILLIRTSDLLRKVIPVDDHIDFHRFVGRVITGLAILHTIAHMGNFGRLTDYSWGVYMFTTIPNVGWVGGFAPLSGVILCLILATIIVCSMEWIRRGGHFQIFYWTHLLYLPFFVFLIVHAENFWKWIIGPLFFFLLEKAYSILTRYSSRSGRTYLHSVTIEQSNVISLNIHRPRNFTFKPGDYITINIPSVALYEFHPFTLSSAPEDTKYLTIHIQAVGNWTKRVYQRFKGLSETPGTETSVKIYRADLHPEQRTVELAENSSQYISEGIETDSDIDDDENTSRISKSRIKSSRGELVLVNGPYSSCARYVFDCKHVVLIGGGIGITPYASILSSLMAQFRASRIVCKNCQHINYHRKGLMENRRLKKVDFIWVNRDQKNFEWFLNLLRQFEQEQEYYLASNSDEERFLDIHLYFTEIKNDENIGNVPLDLVAKVWAEVAGRDIFTSLKSKTHVGRPKWDEIFDQMASDGNASTANDVNVFFCGPSTMGEAIREHCITHRFRYYEEKF